MNLEFDSDGSGRLSGQPVGQNSDFVWGLKIEIDGDNDEALIKKTIAS